ncbi:AGE family epimerase/isomerase [Pinibacter aurantiacus]|uniref:Cellobiose 2-epimerase n=1 Tax=Pinibacter aurantiacus TaxID=2851599 RepID=A0A9E2SBJ0_9BACT|nr:AGE family epimerase/isomerase [Pinibacter aurantiacus]MBV4358419.1 AGE family epimerase/isomerase [Pinibacter aurantiacus]
MNLTQYKNELTEELDNILQYWIDHTIDEEYGGFYGKIDNENNVDNKAPKGSVLNARILWTFAAAFNFTREKKYFDVATRAFDYISKHFIDEENGGVYWTVDYSGRPLDTKKQIYALSFALYAASEYYRASHLPEAKQVAIGLYNIIEKYSFDRARGGYFEAFTKDWKPVADLRLSEKDANEKKTMNTHLHVLEAYTNFYHIEENPAVKQSIQNLLAVFDKHIINQQTHHLELFFDEDWNTKGQIVSFGHDIEAAWLLLEAAEAINDEEWIGKMKTNADRMADAAAEGLDKDGGLWYEVENNHLVKEKHWWPQAEAMVGFFNAAQVSGNEKYIQYSMDSWQFTKQYILDAKNGEWFWGVKEDYSIMPNEDKAGLWKCPYHNGRACLELLKRL